MSGKELRWLAVSKLFLVVSALVVVGLAAMMVVDTPRSGRAVLESGAAAEPYLDMEMPAPDVMVSDMAMPDGRSSAAMAEPLPPVPDGGVSDGSAVVRNAYLVLEVADGAAAVTAMEKLVADVDGFVASTSLSRDPAGVVSGMMVLRVPSDRLDDVVAELDALAVSVPVRNVDSYDVSGQVADVDARLANLAAFEVELRDLLAEVRAGGGDAEQLVSVLDRLRQVRSEIEWLEASRAQLDEQVTLSTVTVEVRPAPAGVPVSPVTWRPSDTVREAAAALLVAATRVVDAAIWLTVTVLPFVAAAAAVWAVAVRLRRRFRRR